jgi:hypothetical protein
MSAKNWVFTINNYSDEDLAKCDSFGIQKCKYLIRGLEVGENGTPHIQGYLQLLNRSRLGGLKKNFHATAHFEIARGTAEEASNYCKKDGNFLEHGELVKKGQRTDLEEVVKLIDEGASIKRIAEECPQQMIKYARNIAYTHALLDKEKKRDWKTVVTVLVGPAGTGKSRYAHEMTQNLTTYYKPTGPWWDGYNGQEAVVIDDFYGSIQYSELLKVLDRYPHKVPVKGAMLNFTPRQIYITSNQHPHDWYPNISDKTPLMRRIENFHFEEIPELPEQLPMPYKEPQPEEEIPDSPLPTQNE